jgi:hypothetical protein
LLDLSRIKYPAKTIGRNPKRNVAELKNIQGGRVKPLMKR